MGHTSERQTKWIEIELGDDAYVVQGPSLLACVISAFLSVTWINVLPAELADGNVVLTLQDIFQIQKILYNLK